MLRSLLAVALVAALIGGCLDADPTEAVNPGSEAVGPTVHHCAEIHAAGETFHDVHFARTSVALYEAGGHEMQDEYNAYVFELFFDAQAMPGLGRHFEQYGWPVHGAAIDLAPNSFRVQSTDGIDYAAELGVNAFPHVPEDTMGDGHSMEERLHVVSGRASFGTIGDNETLGVTLFTATLTAHGGFFGTLGPAEGRAPLEGIAQRMGFSGPSVLQWADAPAPA